ncbi:hypothetical protein A4X13_0g1780 [Tilletia indica]|uniref:Uncharacterized protein n=1 Tax=Tilletia indica TaxID=43049 RepID=A0A177TMX6_9BASI|nr:hypothetical protein A4X13_0g1780 [Tilletia indica]
MEEDGFEIIPGPPPAGPSIPKALAVGALVLELGGERKRTGAASALDGAAREKPRLLGYLSRSDANRGSHNCVWRSFDEDLAEEQASLPWQTVLRRPEDEDGPQLLQRPAGDGCFALRAVHRLLVHGRATAEWTMREEAETAQRMAWYLLVIRLSIYAEEDTEALARLAAKLEPGVASLVLRKSSAKVEKGAVVNRKHLLYALRTDEAACAKQNFSISAAVEAEPQWLLQDSDADAKLTLRELYNTIPALAREPWKNVSERWQMLLKSLIQDDAPPGIRTRLYHFQRHTVAQLLVREVNAGLDPICDPRLVECTTLDGGRFYVDGSNFTIWRRRRALPDCSGSILSEHMGLGKTLECIALILATRGQRASIEPPGEVLPERTRKAGYSDDNEEDSDEEEQEIPPHSFLCRPRPLQRPRASHHAPRVAIESVRPLRIYRSFATLVCVPIELLRQWTDQLEEHLAVPPEVTIMGRESWRRREGDVYDVGDGGGAGEEKNEDDEINMGSHDGKRAQGEGGEPLRILILQGNTGEVPPAAELAGYDIILLTIRRLQAEWKRCGGLILRYRGISQKCSCVYIEKQCTCSEKDLESPVSPLMQCLFRRIIVDEGHVLASTSSNLVLMTKAMNCQSRLIVSGTPTANLVGLANEDVGMGLPPPSSRPHNWTAAEGKDLERVGLLMENFFLHPTFQPSLDNVGGDDNRRDWTRDVMGPLNIKGENVLPDVGAVRRLRNVFARIFVRSGNEAREEADLPRCNSQVVELRMNSAERAMYNALQALIGLVNVSRTKGFSDRRNAKYRAEITYNIKLSMFWLHSPDAYKCIKLAFDHPESIEHPSQIVEQREALSHLRRVLDEVDRNGRPGASLRYFSQHLHPALSSWTFAKPQNDDLPDNISTDAVIRVRRVLDEVQYSGHGLGPEETLERLENYLQFERNTAAVNGRRGDFEDEDEDEDELSDSDAGSQDENKKPILPSGTKDERKSKKARNDQSVDFTRITSDRFVPPVLAETKLMATSSTKLSWVVDYVRKMPADEKVAIFSSMQNIRVMVGDAFDVAQIQYAMHCPEVDKSEHGPALDRFREKPIVRAVIMDFTTGGRGHNIQCASHCLLLEPVWNLDQELQAIKRFHRLGQKREVHVSTLVMKGTFEQEIMARRQTIKRQQADGSITTYMSGVSTSIGGRSTDMFSDPKMARFLERPRYIDPEPGHDPAQARLPFTKLSEAMYPFAHYNGQTGQLMLDGEPEVGQDGAAPARRRAFRAGPASIIGARIQNRAAIEAARAHQDVAQPSGVNERNSNAGAGAGADVKREVKQEECRVSVEERRPPVAGPSTKRARFV